MNAVPPFRPISLPPLDRLIACPTCDVLHEVTSVQMGETARCRRCRTVLVAPKSRAFLRATLLAVTALILMMAAIFLPFLSVSRLGFAHDSSIFQAALAFHGILAPVSLGVVLMIVLLPIVRFVSLIYVLGPMAAGATPLRHARRLYRMSEDLRPWSMAEVFVIGTGVALIKVAGLATVTLGPAFWAFGAMILTTAVADSLLDRWTIWGRLDADNAT